MNSLVQLGLAGSVIGGLGNKTAAEVAWGVAVREGSVPVDAVLRGCADGLESPSHVGAVSVDRGAHLIAVLVLLLGIVNGLDRRPVLAGQEDRAEENNAGTVSASPSPSPSPSPPTEATTPTATKPAEPAKATAEPRSNDSERPQVKPTIVVLVGHEGSTEYREPFAQWSQRWQVAAERAQAEFHRIGIDPESTERSDRDRTEQLLARLEAKTAAPLWIVLIGHGTSDGKATKFNFRGPDADVETFVRWLSRFERPLAVLNCTSASGPFLKALSAPNRIVVTATQSGFEYQFARFGDYLSQAILETTADLDKDQQVSLLEAYLFASKQVLAFYEQEGRLATEHALLDDNGDGLGTPADWFRGTRAVRRAKDGAAVDGLRANQFCLVESELEQAWTDDQRRQRDELEQKLDQLRNRKAEFSPEAYDNALEELLLQVAPLYVTNPE